MRGGIGVVAAVRHNRRAEHAEHLVLAPVVVQGSLRLHFGTDFDVGDGEGFHPRGAAVKHRERQPDDKD